VRLVGQHCPGSYNRQALGMWASQQRWEDDTMTLAGHNSAHGGRSVNQEPPLISAVINQGSIS